MSASDTLAPDVVRRARTGVAVVFALNGAAFATWVSRIPAAREELGLTPGQLGSVLLFVSVGAVLALPSAGWLTWHVGAARAVALGNGAVAVGLVVAGIGGSGAGVVPLAVGLFAIGLGSGTWDVAMNLEGATVERHLGRTIMPRFHAAFSLGTVFAAGLGALADFASVPVVVHLSVLAGVVLVSTLAAVRVFLPAREETSTTDGGGEDAPTVRRHPLAAWKEPRTLLVGVIVLAAAFTEGTANDWLSLALVDGYGTESWVGVLGFATFVSAMTLGRVLGTGWLDRYGRVPVLIAAFALAAVGSLVVVFGTAAGLWLAFVGSVMWGVGASLGFPVGMSAAADEPEHAAARVSVVASIGYTAFLAGPPLLGFLGDRVGILHALLVVGALALPAMLAVPAARPPVGDERPAPDGETPSAPERKVVR